MYMYMYEERERERVCACVSVYVCECGVEVLSGRSKALHDSCGLHSIIEETVVVWLVFP